ncbi:hypothetical protein [Brevibacillus reuszeri]|uniref:hypothetical protein n=1 Tax=Brevibacillus reuszeri TaxID=54915 RepID=UPI003D21D9B5
MNKPAQIDQQQTARFLSLLYGNTVIGWLNIWEKQSKSSLWYPASKIHEAIPEFMSLALKKQDVYYGIGLRKEKKSGTDRGKSSDVCFLPGVWMDIDCSEGTHKKGDLPSSVEAQCFINSLPLKPSIIVNSGGGYHVYWLFTQGIEITNSEEPIGIPELVRDFQNVLRYLGSQHGWSFDNTSDLARVLRVPGTLNYKDKLAPKEVRIISDSGPRYSMDEIHEFIAENAQPFVSHDIYAPEENQYPPSNAELIVEKCAFLRHCRDEAATLSEPKWFAMINVLAIAENGYELIHELSRPYREYKEHETNAKVSRARGDNGIGKPMTCAAIQEKCGDSFCLNCPYNGRIKSPIVLA